MKPWRIDFADRPRSSWVGWVAVLAAALLVGDALWHARALGHHAERLEAAAREPASAPTRAPRRDAAAERELARSELVARRLSLPWDELFRAIESASGQRVALLSIDPDAQAGRVTITGEAADQRAVVAYLGRLAGMPQLRRVHLLRHEVQDEAPQAVRFVMSAEWRAQP